MDELYGIDMNETLRGVNSLMQQYGLTAQEADGLHRSWVHRMAWIKQMSRR